jgi:plasmid stability protein
MSVVQYTIRNIPLAVDRAIRKQAAQSGKSFNQTVVELLTLQTFGSKTPPAVDDNFDWLFGANTLDAGFDEAITELSKPDDRLWR